MQIISGQLLGSPGPTGSPGIYILYGNVDPSASSDANVPGSQLGSLYINYVAATLWQKTALPSTWTQIS